MMPDLGEFSFYVLTAYGVSVSLVVALCLVSVWRARRVRTQMEALEKRLRGTR
ncbi:heme exporter protein CcmD [Roseobacteraceae bacterium S113]